ncbi:MAG: hypothetical protein QOI10_3793 [Solirubrobacterales bacterium]|jgi:hypothetical protein|nr:hypothetical protein [Solirubrobacterales bacterium]
MPAVLVAEARFGERVGMVVANDAWRRTFTVHAGDSLHAVSGSDLSILATWSVDAKSRGSHAAFPNKGFALVSDRDAVVLRHHAGPAWTTGHPPWAGDFESGCTWFDGTGRPMAVIPGPEYDGCLVVSLSRAAGRVVAEAAIDTAPAGIVPVHHRDGWVGLSVGEGQDAARVWWVRISDDDPAALDVIDAGWDDAALADVHHSGTVVVTVPHDTGPIVIRSFPDLEPRRRVAAPTADTFWDLSACFVGNQLVARLSGGLEATVAVRGDGKLERLDVGDGWLVPAAEQTWLTVEPGRIRRWRLVDPT